MQRRFAYLFLGVVGWGFVAVTALTAATPVPNPSAPRVPVFARHGVVTANNPLASQAGLDVLRRGGNAIDAAVTAAAVMSLTEPMMTGIGGDLFATVWIEREQRLIGLNASGRSGSLFTLAALRAKFQAIPEAGAATITVPGALSGWAALLERYGTISLAQALAPAITLADEGFAVPTAAAAEWQSYQQVLRNTAARQTFLVHNQRAPAVGERFRNPDLARTFREISTHGIGWFYGGELGQRVVKFVSGEGGFLTLDDLARHKPLWVEPISVAYGNFRLWELPPNGQGLAALEMLRLAEPFARAALAADSAAYLHALIEAKKLAFADIERFVGDPDLMNVSPAIVLSDAFISKRRELIDFQQARERVEPDERLTRSDTTYLAAADREGNMVSLINSLCYPFGSGLVVPGTGFVLHNRGTGFTLEPGRANTAGPNRRPFHTILPAFITRTESSGKDAPYAVFGVIGGPNQPQAHVQVFLNLIAFGLNAQAAIDAPRFRHLRGFQVYVESPVSAAVRSQLTELGHALTDLDKPPRQMVGTGHIIRRVPGGYEAGSDFRSDGTPSGY